MTAAELQDALLNVFEALVEAKEEIEGEDDAHTLADFVRDMADDLGEVARATSYERVQMLTTDAGLVVRTADHAEFQITIVQSRRGKSE